MSEALIYHLCRRAALDAVGLDGLYHGALSQAGEDFLHFSTLDQVEESAALHCIGLDDLMLLEVAAQPLGEALRWEASRGGALFPHLYRPLLTSDVTSEADLELDADGVPQLGDHLT